MNETGKEIFLQNFHSQVRWSYFWKVTECYTLIVNILILIKETLYKFLCL